jgi:hypothetical protein
VGVPLDPLIFTCKYHTAIFSDLDVHCSVQVQVLFVACGIPVQANQ